MTNKRKVELKSRTVSSFIGKFLKTVKPIVEVEDQICKLCGEKIIMGLHYKKVLSSNFNDFHHCKYQSDYICENCIACMDGKAFDGKAIRNYNLLITKEKALTMKTSEIAENIFNLPKEDFIFGVNTGNRKHWFLNCKINYG